MQALFWAGFATMGAGACVIGGLTHRSRSEDASQGVAHVFACVLGALAYFALVTHQTELHTGDRTVHVAHYGYWLLSQPLILVSVAVAGLPPLSDVTQSRQRATIVASWIGTNLIWNVASLFQGLASDSGARRGWFLVSAAALLALLWQLWRPVIDQRPIDESGHHVSDYRLLVIALSLLWPAYLLVWMLGEAGLRLWTIRADTPILFGLDVANDVAFGIFAVLLTAHSAEVLSPEAGESTVAASERLAASARDADRDSEVALDLRDATSDQEVGAPQH
jgi:bacteriorhodopsin